VGPASAVCCRRRREPRLCSPFAAADADELEEGCRAAPRPACPPGSSIRAASLFLCAARWAATGASAHGTAARSRPKGGREAAPGTEAEDARGRPPLLDHHGPVLEPSPPDLHGSTSSRHCPELEPSPWPTTRRPRPEPESLPWPAVRRPRPELEPTRLPRRPLSPSAPPPSALAVARRTPTPPEARAVDHRATPVAAAIRPHTAPPDPAARPRTAAARLRAVPGAAEPRPEHLALATVGKEEGRSSARSASGGRRRIDGAGEGPPQREHGHHGGSPVARGLAGGEEVRSPIWARQREREGSGGGGGGGAREEKGVEREGGRETVYDMWTPLA